MNLEAIAKAYVQCVELEERAQAETSVLADDLSVLRSDLHAVLMQALKAENISFSDRADAARIAFDICTGRSVMKRSGLAELAQRGIVEWSGGRPKGLSHHVKIKGKPLSQTIIDDREDRV